MNKDTRTLTQRRTLGSHTLDGWIRGERPTATDNETEPRPKAEPRPGKCIDCGGPTPYRENYHTMSFDRQMEASERHHRCRQCHAAWTVPNGAKLVTARKQWECQGCGCSIPRGAKSFRGRVGNGGPYGQQIAVCGKCMSRRQGILSAAPTLSP